MKKDVGLKADGLNDETKEACLGPLGGVIPTNKSIRKRGYHRALKRGEMWALEKHAIQKYVQSYVDAFYNTVLKDNPFQKMVGLNEQIRYVPVVYPGEDDKK